MAEPNEFDKLRDEIAECKDGKSFEFVRCKINAYTWGNGRTNRSCVQLYDELSARMVAHIRTFELKTGAASQGLRDAIPLSPH